MLVSTVSSSALQFFFVLDYYPKKLGMLYFLLGLLSGFLGKYLIDLYIFKSGKQSVIVYLLAFYIVIACISMTAIGILFVIGEEYYSNGQGQLGFRDLCVTDTQDNGLKYFLVHD